MRYKHIVTVGTTLIIIFISLAILMYYFNQDSCPVGTFPCRNSTICIAQGYFCDGKRDCPKNDDESECTDIHLENDYWFIERFSGDSSISVCPHIIKNGSYYENCEYVDCKVFCDNLQGNKISQTFPESLMSMTISNSSIPVLKKDYFVRYPELNSLYLDNNGIRVLERNVFINQNNLVLLILSKNEIEEISGGHLIGLSSLKTFEADNNKIHTLDLRDLNNSSTLIVLDLSNNLLKSSNLSLPFLPNLRELDLDENKLEIITDDMFSGLPMLMTLSLKLNIIKSISVHAFENLNQLRVLYLMFNKIERIERDLFKSVGTLSKLFIGHNSIKSLPSTVFDPLKENLTSLGVEGIDILAEKNAFNEFVKLDFVYFKKFHYCSAYASSVKKCRPLTDGVSSDENLLSKSVLKTAVWGISCVTCLGNSLVLWGRFTAKDENRVLSIVIRNLAVSDMLMGIYLFIIGLEDIRFRNNYNQEAAAWISSWSCTFIGMIAMASSEVSVLILSFMSVERFMLIAAPLKSHRATTPQTAASAMIVVWVIGITLAFIPAIHWRSSTRFYGLNGMCFPLHITDPFLVGWEYSAFIFLGLNFFGLIVIGYVYAAMFVSIWKTRHATPLSVGDSEFALRFFFIVLTDVVCWSPIIVFKILALAEYPVSPDLHSWVVVFILPINSAVNPLLYTFTTPKFRERLNEGWFSKGRKIISRKQSRSGSEISNSYNSKNVVLSTSIKIPNEEKKSQILNETLLIMTNDK